MSDEAGFGIIPRYVRGKLTAIEIAVFVALTWRADSYGMCWPSHDTIAKEAGTSVKSVKRALDSLRDKRLVEWEARVNPQHGGSSSNLYRVAIWQRPPHEVERVGHTDLPPRSLWPTNDTQGTTPIASNEGPSDDAASRGQRERRPTFDADALVAELEDDFEATGFLAGHWADGAEVLIEAARAELKANDAIKDADAWLASALERGTPVRKAARLIQIVGDDYDE